jgi:hypothetical protein
MLFCCKSNYTIYHVGYLENFSLYFVKYPPCRNDFQTKVLDRIEVCIFCHVPFFYDAPFLRKQFRSELLVELVLYGTDMNLQCSSPGSFYCKTPVPKIRHVFFSEMKKIVRPRPPHYRLAFIRCTLCKERLKKRSGEWFSKKTLNRCHY